MFTYNIQFAGYDHYQSDNKGRTDINHFIRVIEEFSWMEQLKKYNQLQQGCSPTVSAVNAITGHVLWVSIAGIDQNDFNYLVGYVYAKNVKSFLRLGKDKVRTWVDIYNLNDLEPIKDLFTIFFTGDHATLQNKLAREELYESMPVKTIDP